MAIPVFLLRAFRHVATYVIGQLTLREGDYQAAVTARLSFLAERVANEFQQEIRARVADLHSWQEGALRDLARIGAAERVRFL